MSDYHKICNSITINIVNDLSEICDLEDEVQKAFVETIYPIIEKLVTYHKPYDKTESKSPKKFGENICFLSDENYKKGYEQGLKVCKENHPQFCNRDETIKKCHEIIKKLGQSLESIHNDSIDNINTYLSEVYDYELPIE